MSSTSFRVGCVVKRFCDFVDPPKTKLCLVVSHEPQCFALLINSNVTPYAQSRPHILAENVPIEAAQNSLLDHDSFVDCTQIFLLNPGQCKHEITIGQSELKGELSYASLYQVYKTVESSIELSPRHKRNIVKALAELLEPEETIPVSAEEES